MALSFTSIPRRLCDRLRRQQKVLKIAAHVCNFVTKRVIELRVWCVPLS